MPYTGSVANQDHLHGKYWEDEIKPNQFTKPTASTTETDKDIVHAPKSHQTGKNQLNLSPVAKDSASSSPPDTSENEKQEVKFVEIEKKPKIIYAKGMKHFSPFFYSLKLTMNILEQLIFMSNN